jgi:large repetitive protein
MWLKRLDGRHRSILISLVHLNVGKNLLRVSWRPFTNPNFFYMLPINLTLRTGNVHARALFTVLFAVISLWASAQPTFVNVGSDLTIACGEDLPASGGVTATSSCAGDVDVNVFVAETGNIASSCTVSTAMGPGIDWSVWLPLLNAPSVAWNFIGDQTLTFYANGTGRLTGTIQNAANSNWQLSVDMRFENGRSWTEWSALGRGYKNDLGLAGNNYLDWTYYELSPSFSHFSGIGALAGSELSLSHLPTNYYFGYQVGVASNNKNNHDGMSGWFSYTGTFNGASVSGNGDVNLDRACQTPEQECGGSEFTYTYRAEDACGAVAFANRVITIVDETAPVIGAVESPLFVPCTLADSIYIMASDACSSVNITYTDEVVEAGCPGVVNRTYTATDGCGNASQATQTLYLVDEGEPEFTVFPADTVLSCQDAGDLNPVVEYNAVCFGTTLTQSDAITEGVCSANYTLVRTYTLTDGCGNSVSQSWTVQVADTEAPVIENVPPSADLNCGDEVPSGEPTAADNCSAYTIASNVATENQSCGYISTTTWTATDACGNSSSASQVVTFVDMGDPSFSYIPESITLNCGELFLLDTAIVNDDCSAVTLAWTDQPLYDCAGSFIRLWRAFDGCGNQALESTVVTLVDNEAPVLVGIPEVTEGSCGGNSITAEVTAIDNCDSEVVVEVSEESVPGNCGSIVTYTWTATDACGNTTTEERTYALTDDSGPVFELAVDTVYASCGDDVNTLNIAAPAVSDACSEITVFEYSDEEMPADCGSVIVRTYTAADGCGNTSSAQQIIVLEDTTSPVFISVPDNVFSSCGTSTDNEVLPVVEDNCSEVTIAYEDEVTSTEGCSGSLIRHWMATDACGNVATYDQEINYIDNTPPTIVSFPEDITAGCDQVPVADATAIVFEDNCSQATASVEDALVPGSCPGGFNIERTYTVTDACGNSLAVTQYIYVVDEVSPVLYGVPADTTIFCGEELPVAETTATDNCSGVDEITLAVEEQLVLLDCGSTILRVYTASDACGNTTSVVQEITLLDNVPPLFIYIPEATTIACGDESSLDQPVAIDGCSEVTITEEQYSIGDCGNSFVRVFTATDGCGNWTTAEQEVTVIDNTPPSFEGIAQTVVLNCGEDAPAADAMAMDACGTVEMTYTDEQQSFGCGYQIMRIYTATDACGNSSDFVQIIQFIDQDGPVFLSTPSDVALSCGDDLPEVEYPQVSDACSEPSEVSYADVTEAGNCPGSYTVLRTFTATDLCGNSSTYIQTITFTDNVAPVFAEFPAVVELTCGGGDAVTVSATDNCSEVVVTYTETVTSNGCGSKLRVYTATDGCGNTSQAEQVVNITDVQAPEFVSFPINASVSCDEVVPVEETYIEYIENCSEVSVSWNEEIVEGDCPSSYTSIRTCTLSDACGNEVTATYTLVVSDNEAPYIAGIPDDLVLECGDVIPNTEVYVVDNCTAQPQFTLTEVMETIGCNMVITRRWTAIDDCGNVAQGVQVVTYVDQTAPVLSEYPEQLVVVCGNAIPDAPSITAVDNCTGDVQVAFTETASGSDPCAPIERTWCAVDCSGNETCHTQLIFFEQPAQAPMLNAPEMRTWQSALDRMAILFTANESGRWGIDAFDVNGRHITNLFVGDLVAGEARRIEMNIDSFVSGIYFIRFTNGESTVTRRQPIVR